MKELKALEIIRALADGIDPHTGEVFPDDSPLLDYCDGMLGMDYFENTTLILDFWNEKLWVKPF